jgi:hypothetical protein
MPSRRYQHDYEDGNEEMMMLNNDLARDALLRGRVVGTRRVNLTQELQDEGRG